jgi:hypothetical protein
MARGAELLAQLGFERTDEEAREPRPCAGCGAQPAGSDAAECPQCRQPRVIASTFRRGKSKPQQAVSRIEEQPQRIAVEWDRGKITLAASISPAGKATPLHGELLTLAQLVEAHVAAGLPLDRLAAQWQELHERIRRHDRRGRIARRVLLGLLVAFILALLALASPRR